jgi:hypothetical protein
MVVLSEGVFGDRGDTDFFVRSDAADLPHVVRDAEGDAEDQKQQENLHD